MSKISCIYKITNLITGQIYIGQTVDYNRRKGRYEVLEMKNQKMLYKSVVRYGWINHKIEIIQECINEKLNELEIFWIKESNSYYYDNKELGLNLTRGGKGERPKGIKCPESVKISNRLKKSIAILQYDLNGNFIREWFSSTEASKELGISLAVIASCAAGKWKTGGNYMWKRKIDNYPLSIEPCKPDKTVKGYKYPNRTPLKALCKPVLQYTISGEFIKEWDGVRIAERALGKGSCKISGHIKNPTKNKTAYGYIWKYK